MIISVALILFGISQKKWAFAFAGAVLLLTIGISLLGTGLDIPIGWGVVWMENFNLKSFKKFMVLILCVVGVVQLSINVFAEDTINTYSINESKELVINADTEDEEVMNYSYLNNEYKINKKGRFVDLNTKLNFKNRSFYMKFRHGGLIYKRYVKTNKYYEPIEYYMQYYPIYKNEKQVQIINGAYQEWM